MAENTGLYLVTQLLNEKFRTEGFKTVTFGDPSEVDLNKQNIYPLMHITLSNRIFAAGTEQVTCNIVWMDIIYEGKPLDQRTTKDVMSNISNTEDIFHDLGYRINRAYQAFRQETIETLEVPDSLQIDAFYAKAENKLAGYEATFVLTIIGGDNC